MQPKASPFPEAPDTSFVNISDSEESRYDREQHSITPADDLDGASIVYLLLLCAPRMAISVAWAAQWAAFGPLLSTIFSAPWKVTLIQVIGPITGLLVAPAVGVLSDHNPSWYGRRRPFILGSTVATILCWCVMMNAPAIGRAAGDTPTDQVYTAVFTVVCYLWMDISVNVLQTSVNLLIADFAGYRQVTAFSVASGYDVIGRLLVSGYIWWFGPAYQTMQWFFVMLLLVLVATSIPVCIYVVEAPLLVAPHAPLHVYKEAAMAWFNCFRFLPRQLAVYCVVFVCLEYGFIAYNGVKGQYFGEHVYHGNSTNANTCGDACSPDQQAFNHGVTVASGVTDTMVNVVSLLYLIVLPTLVRRVGARRVFLWSIVPQMLLVLMAFSHVAALDVAIIVLCSITQATVFALQIPVIMHVIGYGEQEGLGLYYGAFNSANCVGQLLNFAFAPLLIRSSMGYALPVLVGGVLSIIGFFIVRQFFTLRMKTY
ncbi:Aste57867_19053 [Aphanomyces stellatus]|uniref:Aste57867_19053 protein n=1 Tax=Aphanomyces stellatus TaxID=120398 RepID=A0A485LBY6_9STRA|nr:hypothetical protein As57867_018989 [Aphanomyces stellatus]VFT95778.1 Aste57867_19053 [Aphanomyces stellatus]